jgi:hypothetical protein
MVIGTALDAYKSAGISTDKLVNGIWFNEVTSCSVSKVANLHCSWNHKTWCTCSVTLGKCSIVQA